MAFIDKTAFEARVTNNKFDSLINVTGRYQASSADADCSAGTLVVAVSKLPCEGFTGIYNENAYIMNAATASTDSNAVVYAANTYDVQLLAGNHGNMYAVGTETLGLGIPAGRDGTFTKIVFDGDHIYRFGEGNLSSAISTNTYLTIGANGLLTPAASAPTDNGALYFKLEGTGNFVEGTTASFVYYDLRACRVYA